MFLPGLLISHVRHDRHATIQCDRFHCRGQQDGLKAKVIAGRDGVVIRAERVENVQRTDEIEGLSIVEHGHGEPEVFRSLGCGRHGIELCMTGYGGLALLVTGDL